MTDLILHPDVLAYDFEKIKNVLGEEQFLYFVRVLRKEINLLLKEPIANTAPLTKPTLSYYNYRKVKFFSNHPAKGVKPDMRLVYRFVEELNVLQVLAVGFRHSSPDVYKIAENRDNKDFDGL